MGPPGGGPPPGMGPGAMPPMAPPQGGPPPGAGPPPMPPMAPPAAPDDDGPSQISPPTPLPPPDSSAAPPLPPPTIEPPSDDDAEEDDEPAADLPEISPLEPPSGPPEISPLEPPSAPPEIAPLAPPESEPAPTSAPAPKVDAPGELDLDSWDSSFDSEWSEEASVYEHQRRPVRETEFEEEVEWQEGAKPDPTKTFAELPNKTALNKMLKAELEELAESRGVDSSGTKPAIIERLLSD